jgi:hypothetical protein
MQFNSSASRLTCRQDSVSRLDSPLYSTTVLYCQTLPNNHFARTPRKTHFPLLRRRTDSLPSIRHPILERVGLSGNVFTESLPSNGHTCHNINHNSQFPPLDSNQVPQEPKSLALPLDFIRLSLQEFLIDTERTYLKLEVENIF